MLESDYLDNELEASGRELADQHLEKCAACRKTWESLEAITMHLRQAQRQNVPGYLWPRLKAEISRRQAVTASEPDTLPSSIIKLFFMRPSFAAAAAAVILIVISFTVLFQARKPSGAEYTDLISLTGNVEIHEAPASFGSNIEQYLL
jgi:anti-sigma factor RsiW